MTAPRGLNAVATAVCVRDGRQCLPAVLLRTLFCREMQRRGAAGYGDFIMPCDGVASDRWGRQAHRSVWLSAADNMLQSRVDPLLMITNVFARCDTLPKPDELAKPGLSVICQRYLAGLPDRLASEYRSAGLSVNTRITELSAIPRLADSVLLHNVILDVHQVCAGPLFRYCLAHRAGLSDCLAYWHPYAFPELLVSPAHYQRCWPSGFIPSELLNEAFQRRQELGTYIPGGLDQI